MTSPLHNETHKKWEGRIVNGKFPLHQYLGTTSGRAVFLTEFDGKKAVLKLVPVNSQTKDKLLLQWQRIASISHPNLLQMYECGRCELNGASLMLLYAVMEYADVDLAHILAERPITTAETQEMLKPLLEVLADVHSRGLVHAHLYPSNIMAVGDRIKISTDSLCTPEEFKAALISRKANVYDAPEIAQGEISAASDVWSMGVTVIEALTLRQPVMATAEGLSADDLKKIQPVQPEQIPPPFIDIVRNCLRLEPKTRWNIAEISTRLAFANFMAHTPGIEHVATPEVVSEIESTSQEIANAQQQPITPQQAQEALAPESIEPEREGIEAFDWDEEPLFAAPQRNAGFVEADDTMHLDLVPAELFEEPAAVAHLSDSALNESALSESALNESLLNEADLEEDIRDEDEDFVSDLEPDLVSTTSSTFTAPKKIHAAAGTKKALPKWAYYIPFAAAALAIVIFIPKHHSSAAQGQIVQLQSAPAQNPTTTQAATLAAPIPVPSNTRRSRHEREATDDVAQSRRSRRHHHQSDSPMEQASVVEPAPAAPAPSVTAPAASTPAASTPAGNANDNAKGGIMHQALPKIPKEIRENMGGAVLVWVHVSVDPAGHVTQTSFDSAGPNPDIAQLTQQAAQQWRFSAPQVNGEKVAAEWTLRFTIARDSMRVVPVQVTP
jgi:serine/threonine protein kinase/outer membrane biosynthesis protein TonB